MQPTHQHVPYKSDQINLLLLPSILGKAGSSNPSCPAGDDGFDDWEEYEEDKLHPPEEKD